MKGEVSIAPSGGVLIKKGLSTKAALRAFGSGTVLGVGVGFVGGFALAQAIYSDEHASERACRALQEYDVIAQRCKKVIERGPRLCEFGRARRYQRETVKRTVKITAGACGVLAVVGLLSSLRR